VPHPVNQTCSLNVLVCDTRDGLDSFSSFLYTNDGENVAI